MRAPLVLVRGHRNQRLQHARPLVKPFGQLVVGQQPGCHLGQVFWTHRTGAEQPLQALDRLGRDGVNLQRLQIRVGGSRRLGQRSSQQPPHAQKNCGPLILGAQAHLTGKRLDQPADIPHRIQDSRQLTHKPQVCRFDLASLAQGSHSGLAVTQTLLLHMRHAQQDLSASGGVLHTCLAHVLQSDQSGPVLAARVQLEQSGLGLIVAGNQGQDLLGETFEIARTVDPSTGDQQAPAQKVELLLAARPLLTLVVQPGSQQRQQCLPLFGRLTRAFQIGAHVGIGGCQPVGPGAPLEGQRLGL